MILPNDFIRLTKLSGLLGPEGSCYICGTNQSIQEHHIIPRSTGGEQGPTIMLCSNCHSAIHHQALNIMAKKAERKTYFTPQQMERARPLIRYVIIATMRLRMEPDANQMTYIQVPVSKGTLFLLHLLKSTSGESNIAAFTTRILESYVRSKFALSKAATDGGPTPRTGRKDEEG